MAEIMVGAKVRVKVGVWAGHSGEVVEIGKRGELTLRVGGKRLVWYFRPTDLEVVSEAPSTVSE